MNEGRRTLLLEPYSGISGDMLLGALVGLGVPLDVMSEQVERLGLADRVQVTTEPTTRNGISATRVHVLVDGETEVPSGEKHDHAHLSADQGTAVRAVLGRIEASALDPDVKQTSLDVYRRLIAAEAAVHGIGEDQIHLHEVGALDATVDVVCAVAGVKALDVEGIVTTPPADGGGETKSAHGLIPVPAPATTLLMEGRRVRRVDVPMELVTPTGAALLVTLAQEAPRGWSFTAERIAYGAGTREIPGRPNVLRASVGTLERVAEGTDSVMLLQTAVDDATPEIWSYVIERLLAAGALDAWVEPLAMKKGRPGVQLTVVTGEEGRGDLENIIFAETPTLGIRITPVTRRVLPRRSGTLETELGTIRVKLSRLPGEDAWRVHPEYEACRDAALRHARPLGEVYDVVRRAAEQPGALRVEEGDDV